MQIYNAMNKQENELMQKLLKLHSENPNDMTFGNEVRKLVWEHIQQNSPAY
jgi:hypothetical protein